MSEMFLQENSLQELVTEFRGNIAGLREVKFEGDADGAVLDSVDAMIECVDSLNTTISEFCQLLELDAGSMEGIRLKWLGVDQTLASQNLQEK